MNYLYGKIPALIVAPDPPPAVIPKEKKKGGKKGRGKTGKRKKGVSRMVSHIIGPIGSAGGTAPTDSLRIAVIEIDTPLTTGDVTYTAPDQLNGLTPKAAMFFASGRKTSESESAHCRFSFGFTDEVSLCGTQIFRSADAQASSLTRERHAGGVAGSSYPTTRHIVLPNATVDTDLVDGRNLRFTTDGVTINWNSVDASNSYRVYVILFAGDDLSAKVGSFDLLGSAVDVSTVGFLPDLVFFGSYNWTSANTNYTTQILPTIGAATQDGTQKCLVLAESNSVAGGSQPSALMRSDKCGGRVTPGGTTVGQLVTASDFDASGFTVTPSASVGSFMRYYYLALNFGGKSVKLWDFVTPTSTGNVSDTTPGWKPQFGVIIGSMLEALDAAVFNTAASSGFGFSAFNASQEGAIAGRIQAGQDPTVAKSDADAKAMLVSSASGPDGIVATLGSFGSNGWTLNYTAVQAAAKTAFAIAIQE